MGNSSEVAAVQTLAKAQGLLQTHMTDTLQEVLTQRPFDFGNWSVQSIARLEEVAAASFAAVDVWHDNPGSTYLDKFDATANRDQLVEIVDGTPRRQVLQDLADLRARHQNLAANMSDLPNEEQSQKLSALLSVQKQIAPALFTSVKLLAEQLQDYLHHHLATVVGDALGEQGFDTDLSQSRDDKGLFRADLHFRKKGTNREGAATEEKA